MCRFAIIFLFSLSANADILVNHQCGVVQEFIGTYKNQQIHAVNPTGLSQPVNRFIIKKGTLKLFNKMIYSSHNPKDRTKFIINQTGEKCFKI